MRLRGFTTLGAAGRGQVRSWAAGHEVDVGGDGGSFCAMTLLISVRESLQETPFVELLSTRLVTTCYCLPVGSRTMNKKKLRKIFYFTKLDITSSMNDYFMYEGLFSINDIVCLFIYSLFILFPKVCLRQLE